ncbi:MAG: SDR family NAD(P)-dependent oxidoreductase [Oligoflexia bacterium]|nr:SDR family NAD(P)-dependent oxidoreductase [Oligoflexia bacterium]
MKKAIIVGASSGIGREIALVLAKNGYQLGLIARRSELLTNLQSELQTKSYIRCTDITKIPQSMLSLEKLIEEMESVDLIILNAGVGYINPEMEWIKEQETIEVNVMAFAALANVAIKYFLSKRAGHLVGISSVAAIRGMGGSTYGASKAFVSNYLEALQHKIFKQGLAKEIVVTEIIPGFVDTAMAKGEGLFWVAPAEKAALQIYRAIERKCEKVYITKRWVLVAILLKLLPKYIFKRIF